ncbi:MAG TPA: fibronectin type III domain-containing protein [Candidatus Thermoplasmatota archaeon]|nr:fibronectin type III domain-containing protein [Candidatus Thermoplasmatota archaeon]
MNYSARSSRVALTLVLALVLPGLGLPAAGTEGSSTTSYEETWDATLTGWSPSGPGVTGDCVTALDGCSLRIDPPCCDTYSSIQRALDLPLTGLTEVSFAFRGSSLGSDTDTVLYAIFDNGDAVYVTITDAWSLNNRLAIGASGSWLEHDVAQWTSPDTWYRASLYLEPAGDVAWVELKDFNGTVLGTSGGIDLPANATRLTALRVDGVSWSTYQAVYHYDELRVGPGTFDRPLPPGNVTAQVERRNVTLQWEAPRYVGASPLAAYRIYRGAGYGANVSLLATVTADTTSFTDLNLTSSRTYVYRLSAVSESGAESALGARTYVYVPRSPDVPSGLRYFRLYSTPDSVELAWEAPLSAGRAPITGYIVARGPDLESLVPLATLDAEARSYRDDTAAAGERYRYAVWAVNPYGEGPRASRLGGIGGPDAPLNVSVVPGNRMVTIRWEAPANEGAAPVTHYVVEAYYEAMNVRDRFRCYASPCTVEGIPNGKNATFQVSAVNTHGDGRPTAKITVVPTYQNAPAPVLGVALPTGPVLLTWNAPVPESDEYVVPEGYHVDRRVGGGAWERIGETASVEQAFVDAAPIPHAVNIYRVTPWYYDTTAYGYGAYAYDGTSSTEVAVAVA